MNKTSDSSTFEIQSIRTGYGLYRLLLGEIIPFTPRMITWTTLVRREPRDEGEQARTGLCENIFPIICMLTCKVVLNT